MKTLRVAANSKATALAGAIAWGVRQHEDVEMVAIGPAAVNQAAKAAAIARTYLTVEGLDLAIVPEFDLVTTRQEEDRTAMRLRIVPHATSEPTEVPSRG